jgi:hypothetical protein
MLPPNSKHQGNVSAAIVATFNHNLQDLGYTLSPEVIKALRKYSEPLALSVMNEVLLVLRELRGDRVYRPMYPNFPAQVIEAEAAELYLNAFFHYFSVWVSDATGNRNLIWLPKYKKDARVALDEKVELTVIGLATEQDVIDITQRIVTSNTSISETDQADLKWLVENDYFVMPPAIPYKENLAIVAALFVDDSFKERQPAKFDEWFKPLFKTATDVMRLAVVRSNGDVSLKINTKFRRFKRWERQLFLSLLEQCGATCAEDMFRQGRKGERWLRLAERLNPQDYRNKFPKAYRAVQLLRAHPEQIKTFNSKVEQAVRAGDAPTAVGLLSKRPGEFARRLDHLLRQIPKPAKPPARWRAVELITETFASVAGEVSTPVLLQVLTHFKHRNTPATMRVIFPKGSIAKVRAIPPIPGVLEPGVIEELTAVCTAALKQRFRTLEKMGKVYVDPKLGDYLVPFSQRSASRSLRTLVRGSRIEFPEGKNTIRFFVYWKNQKNGDSTRSDIRSRVDIDLSALLYGPKWDLITQIAYYNLRSDYGEQDFGFKAVHSGDITDAPTGASEFIDVDIPSALKAGVRYIVMDIRSFTEQLFSDLTGAYAGWMLREKPQSGEVFEPKTVVDRADITSAAIACMPLILDLEERKVIWMDVVTPGRARGGYRRGNNALNNLDSIALIATAFTQIAKPTLYDLLTLHASARGKLVADSAKADVVFSVASGTPYEIDKIASAFLPSPILPGSKPKALAAKKK